MKIANKFKILNSLKNIQLLTILKLLLIIVAVTFSAINISCQSAASINSQTTTSPANPLPASTAPVYTCRSQISIYSERPVFDAEFDFANRQFKHLPVTIKRLGESQEKAEIKVWDALYGTDGDYDYWTTPILRDFSLEKTSPLVISRASSRDISETAEKLQATLSASFGKKNFPVTCSLKTVSNQHYSTNTTSDQKQNFDEFYTCRSQVSPVSKPLLDVEFDYLINDSIQNIYVQVKLLGKNTAHVQLLEAFFGSDGDYSFWTTPVLRDVSGGTFPLVLDMEPGIIGLTDNRSRPQQLNAALSVSFMHKDYPVKCSQN